MALRHCSSTPRFHQSHPPAIITAQGVTCAVCQRAISDEYFDVNGQSVCDGCRTQLAQLAQTPRSWGLFAKAGLFGLVAAILGAILYYAVIAITNFEIGIVAIAIGYMVGWAIRKATANRGGRRFQVLALVLTYWAVGLAYTPLTFQQLAEENKKEQAQTATDTAAPAPAESPDEATAMNIPMVLAILVGFSLALPVLVGVRLTAGRPAQRADHRHRHAAGLANDRRPAAADQRSVSDRRGAPPSAV